MVYQILSQLILYSTLGAALLDARDDIRILIIRINSRIFKGMRIRIINLDIRIFDRQLICHYPLEIRFPTITFPAKLEILYLSALS